MSEREKDIIHECLHAAAHGPFFPESEFHILFGLNRNELFQIIQKWPKLDENDEAVRLAINGVFNNLLGYPHKRDDVWHEHISVSRDEIELIYKRWKTGKHETP